MSVIEDMRSALQDFVAPQLRELKAEIAGLRGEVKSEIAALRSEMKARFDHLEILLGLDARLTRLETMAAKPPDKQ
jgi:hypothetical protein